MRNGPAPTFKRHPLLKIGAAGLFFLAAGGNNNCNGGTTGTPPIIIETGPPCTCYLSSDCAEGQTCHWNFGGANCANNGKFDGVCEGGEGGVGDPGGEPGTTTTPQGMQLVGTGFDSIIPAIANGGGIADETQWEEMADYANDSAQLYGARVLVHQSLQITLGWDLNISADNEPMAPPNVRLVLDTEASLAMLHATRSAMLAAIATKNPDAVSGPIMEFWQSHPGFEPGHLGRCYPHGHEGLQDPPILCQVDELQRMATTMLASVTYDDQPPGVAIP
ncbi:MAG: hypothetical protein AAF799_28810 [Myxococcota bacterium]